MNNRDYKVFAAGNYYHVFNRGIGRMDIFLEPQDWLFFMKRMKEMLFPDKIHAMTPIVRRRPVAPGAFTLISYCLMPNHFHFLVRQNQNIPISKMITKLCTSYGKYFNKKYDRVGGLFQRSFKSILIEKESYLVWLSAYIHNNPTTAKIVKNAEDWPWSSYTEYLNPQPEVFCETELILNKFQTKADYGMFVQGSLEKIKSRKELQSYLLD